ncbi:MAG TPA: hypothetical protein GXZ24_09460 [Firmicutes bacterium]|nr:hypothetical protein [Bacillota bacterium]
MPFSRGSICTSLARERTARCGIRLASCTAGLPQYHPLPAPVPALTLPPLFYSRCQKYHLPSKKFNIATTIRVGSGSSIPAGKKPIKMGTRKKHALQKDDRKNTGGHRIKGSRADAVS